LAIETQILNGTINQIINFNEPDLIAYVGMSIAGITAFFLWRQIRKQSKVDSARFTIDYIDKLLTKNKEVVGIIYERSEDNTKKFKSDKSVRILLNQIEDVIQFKNDGIIKKTHVLNTLGILFSTIKKDSEVKRIINEAQKKEKTAFELFEKFLEKNIK